MSFTEERVLRTVTVERDSNGSLGLQVFEGEDGQVYIQSIVVGGSAHLSGDIFSGDQVIAVNDRDLLQMKYNDALEVMKNSGKVVRFTVARVTMRRVYDDATLEASKVKELKACKDLSDINVTHLQAFSLENKLKRLSIASNTALNSPVEKYLTESCHDVSNLQKHKEQSLEKTPTEVPYHKHIRYEIEPENDPFMSDKNIPTPKTPAKLNKNFSKSCTQIYSSNDNNTKAVVVGVIPKARVRSLDRKKHLESDSKDAEIKQKTTIPPIPLPRTLGLSRKWRGPVKYPVTPVKRTLDKNDSLTTTSDEEQVFI